MTNRDWLVTEDGRCQAYEISQDSENPNPQRPYRLYRFLTDLEDILETVQDEPARLEKIRPLVRRLLTSSYWLQGEYLEPNPETGWSVLTLYDEPEFPLTVQMVTWLPGRTSPIHNHAAWGVVALLSGEEKNTFWRRTHEPELPDRIEQVGEHLLVPGDIISFVPDAIHNVEIMGDEPSITLSIYGATDYNRRFEFNPITHTAQKF